MRESIGMQVAKRCNYLAYVPRGQDLVKAAWGVFQDAVEELTASAEFHGYKYAGHITIWSKLNYRNVADHTDL